MPGNLIANHLLTLRLTILLIAVAQAAALVAGEEKRPPAWLVPVPLPIKGDVDAQVQAKIEQILQNADSTGGRPTLVLEFRPADQLNPAVDLAPATAVGAGSDFGRALSLARFLSQDSRLSNVRTVAWMPCSVEGHAVLVVLACEELIAHPNAVLGRAGVDSPQVDDLLRQVYADIATRRKIVPPPVALGMLDANVEVLQVETIDGIRFVQREDLAKLESESAVGRIETISHQGDLLHFSGTDMRLMHAFTSHQASSREQLATVLELPLGAFQENPSLLGEWRGMRFDIVGQIHGRKINEVSRSLSDVEADDRLNLVLIKLDSPGGSPLDSARLANQLAALDASRVRTVACIPDQCRGDAALIAMACDQIYMSQDAVLGGPGAWHMRRRDLADLREPLVEIARAKHRNWSLMLASLDPSLPIYQYTHEVTDQVRYFCEQERQDQHEPDQWKQGEPLDISQGFNSQQGQTLGIVTGTVSDFDELVERLNVSGELTVPESAWLVTTVERLGSQPWFARTLLFIAFFALISEASSPGLGVPGFLSALCFLLFFWTQFLNGTADWLNVLLFIGGALFVVIEVAVIPGFGAFGIGGLLMIGASLALSTQTFVVPRNSYQYEQLANSLLMLVAGGAGGLVALVAMRRLLPNAPILNRLVLSSPDEDTDDLRHRESLADFDYLLGKRGTATTRLCPSGKASFGDTVVNVISEGEMLSAGTPVSVAKVEGNRIVVRPIES